MNITKYHNTDDTFAYICYTPEKISKHPALIIQLHGAGERGDGMSELDVVLKHGFANIVNDDNLTDAILVMPQCPKNTFWAAKIESIKRFIDSVTEKYNVDKQRVYLCGLSMGGFGTWYTAMAYPDMFAAIVPCCGGGMAWNAGVLKMPIWAFHGKDDTVVSPNQTIEMINALENNNPELRYDLYDGVGHNSWVKAFSEKTLCWMLSKRKK